ncbi:MAG: phage tail protein [Symploca sp. SIO1C2]|nr:phage tail protein [Symploca sp. SIO1C2]
MATLEFPILIEGATQSFQIESSLGNLGDGFDQLSLPCGRVINESWELSTPAISTEEKNELIEKLRSLSGASSFQWRFLPEDDYENYLCDNWREHPLGQDLWGINITIQRTDHWVIDECLLRPVDEVTDHPLIPINLYYGSNQSFQAKYLGPRLAGGVEHRGSFGMNATTNSWSIKAPLNTDASMELLTFLKDRCGSSFEFRLVPNQSGQIYHCLSWQRKYLGNGWWEWSAEFKRNVQPFRKSDVLLIKELFDFYSNRNEIIAVINATFADLDEKLDGSLNWLTTYTRDEYPLILNSQYLLVNSFHTVLGRGGYFPPSAGPTEAQAVISRACCVAYLATGNQAWLNLAIATGDALLAYFYVVPITSGWTTADGIRVPHWLINIKAPFVAKGAIAEDPLNMGHFDLVLDFVNGIAQIPAGHPHWGDLVANVYRVYPATDKLLWQNVFAQPIGGFSYPLDYWVTNVMLEGIVSRQYGDSESPGGRVPTPTNEPTGTIVLATPFTGQAKVVYSTYSGGVIYVNELFEPYPMWRRLRVGEALAAIDVFPWSADAYTLLYQLTGASRFLDAYNATVYSEVIAATVINPSSWYKKEDSPNPFSYPGSQVIPVPDTRAYTASRVALGDKLNWLQVDVAADANPYPSIELQNFAVAVYMARESTVYVEAAGSEATELEVVLSLSKDPFDFSLYYIARLPVPGLGIPIGRIFVPQEFLLWDTTKTSWHPHIADNPIYTYQGGRSSVAIARISDIIEGIPRQVWKIDVEGYVSQGYAGAGLVLIGAVTKFPLRLYLKHVGNDTSAWIAVTVNGIKYHRVLEKADWQEVVLPAVVFEDLDNDLATPAGDVITHIEIEAAFGLTSTWIWWVSAAPNELPVPVQTYKATLVSRIKTAHTFWCGDFTAINSPSEQLKYSPIGDTCKD